jgi:hypothetical protein
MFTGLGLQQYGKLGVGSVSQSTGGAITTPTETPASVTFDGDTVTFDGDADVTFGVE